MGIHDVLIVGGGPAGSSLARALVRAGLDVVVQDRRTFPRDKVCAGWITPAVAEGLDLDFKDYGAGRTLQPIYGFRMGVLGARETCTRRSDVPVSWGIRRCEFDDYLLRRSGAELFLGRPISELKRENGTWVTDDGLRADLLVGAGGHACPVARRFNVRCSPEMVVAAQEIEFEMTPEQSVCCPVEADVPELYFCRDLAGYGWIFRKGNWLNVGLGREDGHHLPAHVEEFRELLIAMGRLPPDMPDGFHGHAYLLYTSATRPVVDDGLLLVGDAAGLAYSHSGEGIRPAAESALVAARVIEAARGDFSREALDAYRVALERRFGTRRIRGGQIMGRAGWLKRAVAARLLATEWFARRVVIDRWFLHRHQPIVIPK